MRPIRTLIILCLILGACSGCTRERLDTFKLARIQPASVTITHNLTDKIVQISDSVAIRELLSLVSDCGPKNELVKMYPSAVIKFETDTEDYWFGIGGHEYIKHKSGCYRLADPDKLNSYLKTLGVDF